MAVRRLRVLGVCLLVFASATRLGALDPSRRLSQAVHRIWQVQQGLPEATIYALAQGADGYLWLGTETGLVRFDGVRFAPIDHAGPLAFPKTRVQTLGFDAHQTLWIGTADFGLVHVSTADQVDHYLVGDGLPSNDIRCVVPDGDRLWICTAHGLAELRAGIVTTHGVPPGWGGPEVTSACLAPDGALWIGGDGPLVATWDGAGFHSRPLDSVTGPAAVRALSCEPTGDVWVGTSAGLVHLGPGGATRDSHHDGRPWAGRRQRALGGRHAGRQPARRDRARV